MTPSSQEVESPAIPGRFRFFEAADLERVLAHLPAALRAPVWFAFLTGWRRGEVLPLQWSQVDWTAGAVRLAPGTTKNREGREFPFRALPQLEALLEEQRAQTRAIEKETGTIIPHVFGVSRSVAMKLSGHKTMSVFSRYAIADSAALAEGVEKLAKLHAKPQPGKVRPIQEAASRK